MTRSCEHVEADPQLDPPLDVCSWCVEIGATWVHLRQCLTCGRTSRVELDEVGAFGDAGTEYGHNPEQAWFAVDTANLLTGKRPL